MILDDKAEVSLLEFIVSHCGEFVETFLVGFVSFSIVAVNFVFVNIENSLSVSVFKG